MLAEVPPIVSLYPMSLNLFSDEKVATWKINHAYSQVASFALHPPQGEVSEEGNRIDFLAKHFTCAILSSKPLQTS